MSLAVTAPSPPSAPLPHRAAWDSPAAPASASGYRGTGTSLCVVLFIDKSLCVCFRCSWFGHYCILNPSDSLVALAVSGCLLDRLCVAVLAFLPLVYKCDTNTCAWLRFMLGFIWPFFFFFFFFSLSFSICFYLFCVVLSLSLSLSLFSFSICMCGLFVFESCSMTTHVTRATAAKSSHLPVTLPIFSFLRHVGPVLAALLLGCRGGSRAPCL
jgi:hypothetical protein